MWARYHLLNGLVQRNINLSSTLQVTQVSINRVLNAEAYLLFYKRVKSKVPNISEVHPTEQKPASPSGISEIGISFIIN